MPNKTSEPLDRRGKFMPLERHQGVRRTSMGSLFSGATPLKLHNKETGAATVKRAVFGRMSMGAVQSTGHDVTVRESTSVSLVLPLQGAMTTELGGKTITAGAGTGLLLPRGHRNTRVVSPKTGRYSAFVLMLDADALAACRDVEQQKGLLLDGSQSRDVLDALQMTRLLAEQLDAGSRLLDRPGAAKSWFELITSSLDQGVESLIGDTPSAHDACSDATRYVTQAEDYMRWNLVDIVSTLDVANEVGISRRTLETAFQRVRGDSPAKVLARLRLMAARHLLLDPDGPNSVTEVCLDCGIGHHGRFSAAYMRQYGETPSQTLRRR